MALFQRQSAWDDLRDTLAHQIALMQREAGAVGRTATTQGQHLTHAASEMGDALLHGGKWALRRVRRTAKKTGRAVREDPMPTLAVVVAAGCLISLVLGRK